VLLAGMNQAKSQTQPAAQPAGDPTVMEQLNMANPEPKQALQAPPAATAKKEPFFDDTKISAQARTFYFNRDKYDNTRSEAWTLGGSVAYQSGYIGNLFRIGGVAYTSQPLYAPEDRDGTLLLKPGQQGYAVLGQAYGEFKITEGIFGAFGRKEYETPYVNKQDIRMTPNTFEGVTVYGKEGGKNGAPEWRFGGGYLTRIKEKNSDEFKWMSTVAGAAPGIDHGVFLGGLNFEQKGLFSVGAINYYSDDVINIFYSDGRYELPLGEGSKLKLMGQYSDQRSTGDNLLTGQSFSTHQWGIKGELGLAGAVLTLGYTDTGGGADMRNPWGGHPGYTSQQVKDFYRANESAVILKAAYDFSSLGAQGLTGYALWVHGSGVEAPRYNEDEYDFNLQWTPSKSSELRGLSFRMRYARINQRGGGDPAINDFRFIVNYDFPRP
jgi:outer membrane porin, OprD family